MCVCVCVCVCVCLPSLFAGDTPPVYTAPANAIFVVGPCLWALLRDVHMKTDQALAQSPFQVVMHSSLKCLLLV